MTDPVPSIDQRVRAAWNASAPHEQWIVELDLAAGHLIVTDEKDRSFARVPVLVGDAIEFGQPVPVVPGYLEMEPAVAASRVVFASRAESRPDVPPDPRLPMDPMPPAGPPPAVDEPVPPPPSADVPVPPQTPGAEPEPNTEPKEGGVSTLSTDVRSRLGLTDDADDAAVMAALDELKTKADQPAPDPEQVAASAKTAQERDELRKEVAVLASQMTQVTTELAQAKAEKAASVKASVLGEAKRLGKIAPADEERWSADYDEAPAAVTRILASIAVGTAVPVVASGHTGDPEAQVTDDDLMKAFFPPADIARLTSQEA